MKPEVANEIARLMRDPDALRHEWEHMQRFGRRGHYDPNQPRVPAGHSDSGQWTTTGGRPANDAHDRAPIDQGWADPSLTDIAAGQPPIERVEARIGRRRIPNPFDVIDTLRLGLYNELSARNGANQRAVIEFRAAQYGRRAADVTFVGTLSRSEVGKLCERLGKVQDLTDEAVAYVRSAGPNMSPQQFGTAVHTHLRNEIRGFGAADLTAEVSFLKGMEENYGVEGTVRIDALERVRERPDTVCIYDIKTGRSGLSFPRMLEMVVNSRKAFGNQIRHFIVTEVRPAR